MCEVGSSSKVLGLSMTKKISTMGSHNRLSVEVVGWYAHQQHAHETRNGGFRKQSTKPSHCHADAMDLPATDSRHLEATTRIYELYRTRLSEACFMASGTWYWSRRLEFWIVVVVAVVRNWILYARKAEERRYGCISSSLRWTDDSALGMKDLAARGMAQIGYGPSIDLIGSPTNPPSCIPQMYFQHIFISTRCVNLNLAVHPSAFGHQTRHRTQQQRRKTRMTIVWKTSHLQRFRGWAMGRGQGRLRERRTINNIK